MLRPGRRWTRRPRATTSWSPGYATSTASSSAWARSRRPMRSFACRFTFGLAVVAVAGRAPAGAADEGWTRVRSAHFEVLSDASPEQARGVSVALERFRRVMAAVLGRGPGRVDPP